MAIGHPYPPFLLVGSQLLKRWPDLWGKEGLLPVACHPPFPTASTSVCEFGLLGAARAGLITDRQWQRQERWIGSEGEHGGQPGLVLDCRRVPTCHELGCCAAPS